MPSPIEIVGGVGGVGSVGGVGDIRMRCALVYLMASGATGWGSRCFDTARNTFNSVEANARIDEMQLQVLVVLTAFTSWLIRAETPPKHSENHVFAQISSLIRDRLW